MTIRSVLLSMFLLLSCAREASPRGDGVVHSTALRQCESRSTVGVWNVSFCALQPYETRGSGTRTTVMMGSASWPFLGGHRFTLELANASQRTAPPSGVTISRLRTLRAGAFTVFAYQKNEITMQCPAELFELDGPHGTLRLGYPNCGIRDDAFHAASEEQALAFFSSVQWIGN